MSPTDTKIIDELRGAVTDMAAVIAEISCDLPSDVYRRVRDRLWGMDAHIERANSLADMQRDIRASTGQKEQP